MINWMLERVDCGWHVEDVACVVDDMEATDCSRSLFNGTGVGNGKGRLNKDSVFNIQGPN